MDRVKKSKSSDSREIAKSIKKNAKKCEVINKESGLDK